MNVGGRFLRERKKCLRSRVKCRVMVLMDDDIALDSHTLGAQKILESAALLHYYRGMALFKQQGNL